MSDYSWVAPISTGVAGLVSAAVVWRVATHRIQLLKTALDLRDRIPPEIQQDWDFLIYRTAEAVLRRNTSSSMPLILLLTGWVVSIAAILFDQLWLTGVAVLLAIAAWVVAWAKRRQLVKDQKGWIDRLKAENRRLKAQGATLAVDLRDLNVEAIKWSDYTVRSLYKDGMARPALYRYRLKLHLALRSGTDGPDDPRLTRGMSVAWRMRARWRKVRGSKHSLPEDPVVLGALERYEADEAKARPEPPASS